MSQAGGGGQLHGNCQARHGGPAFTRVVAWNPLSLARPGRLEDILHESKGVDALVMTGAQSKERGGGPTKAASSDHWGVQFGWGKGGFTNKACGVDIYLKKRRWRQINLAKVIEPPRLLTGKEGRSTSRSTGSVT